MKIQPMEIGFGAVVDGADLKHANPAEAQALRAALLEHGLLVLRGQALTPHELVAASGMFGALETFPPSASQLPGLPQVFRVASRGVDGHVDVGRYWHSDGSFRELPTPISIWYPERRAEQGGDTLFTDLREAWATLPDATRAEIGGLHTLHRNGVRHPLAMRHPHSGAEVLYLNVGLTGGIEGVEPAAAAAIIGALDRHLSRPGATYRHQWQEGDVVVADNFRVAHQATPVGPDQRRILNRTTVRGDGAFWERLAA
jgi:taurine dioxygenase